MATTNTDYVRFPDRGEVSLGPNFAKKPNKQEHKILLKFPITFKKTCNPDLYINQKFYLKRLCRM